MQCYTITTNPETVGSREVVPLWEYDPELPNNQDKFSGKALPDFLPVFAKLYIDRPTPVIADEVAIGGEGFIVNGAVRRALEGFDLGVHKFYKLDAYAYETKISR